MTASDMRITFMGNGDSLGTPRVYCDCEVCQEARTTGENRRLRSAIWLETAGEEPLLVDCGPDWRKQMERLGVRQVQQGLLTHAHFDHIGGLWEWADACRWLDVTGEIHAPAEVLEEVHDRFPWIGARLKLSGNDQGMRYGEWFIRPWKVNHGKNGYSYAYRFEHAASGRAWAYCPDAINLTEAQQAPLAGLSLLVLGTSFYEEPYAMETRSMYDVMEGLALVSLWKIPSVIFTHLSHDIDVRRNYGLPAAVRLAYEGMIVSI